MRIVLVTVSLDRDRCSGAGEWFFVDCSKIWWMLQFQTRLDFQMFTGGTIVERVFRSRDMIFDYEDFQLWKFVREERGEGGGRILENLHAESLDEDRFDRVMENFYWASDTWSIVRLFFKFWRMLAFFFFFRESRFFDSCDFLQEEWRSWELGYRVFWSSRSTIVKSSSSVFVWVWSFERWYFVTCSIVFRILENVTFDGLHYCIPSFAFSFHKDSYPLWKYLHFLV